MGWMNSKQACKLLDFSQKMVGFMQNLPQNCGLIKF